MSQFNPIWIAVLCAVVSFAALFVTLGIDNFLTFSHVHEFFATVFGVSFLLVAITSETA